MKSHMKRIAAPKTWPIARKVTTFITRAKPSGQRQDLTLPLVVIMRDMLGVVETKKQAGTILNTQEVLVNGKRVYRKNAPVGFMDVLTLGGENYRVSINKNNVLTVEPIKKTEAFTLQKITGKTSLKGGKIQLNTMSGMNILVDKDTYKTGDTISVADGKIKDHFPLAEKAPVLIIGGSHIGTVATVEKVDGKTMQLKADKETLTTTSAYAYVIGKDKPAITV